MKRYLSIFAIAIVAITAMCLTSCGKDDEPSSPTFKSAQINLTYNYSDNFLKLFDVTYTVTGYDGTTKSFNVTKSGQQTQTITTTTAANATATVKVVTEFKSSVQLTGEQIEIKTPEIALIPVKTLSDGTTKEGEYSYAGVTGTAKSESDIYNRVSTYTYTLDEAGYKVLSEYFETGRIFKYTLKNGEVSVTTTSNVDSF